MKVLLVTGSYPPEVCGVGDYTANLVKHLRKAGVEVEVMHGPSWSLFHLPHIIKEIKSKKPDVLHIQYPTLGYGFHITPQLLSLCYPAVITFHEVSQVHLLRQLSLFLFSRKRNRFLFTNEYEKDYALRFAPWIQGKTRVIPIGSNIPKGEQAKNLDKKEIIYFGILREKKGIEQVIQLARLIKDQELDYHIRMVGSPDGRSLSYLEGLYEETKELPVIWEIGKGAEEVANLLSQFAIGYLPFPDGASERRGSLLAFFINGVHPLTTQGPFTPKEFHQHMDFVATPGEALTAIRAFFAREGKKTGKAVGDYGRQFLWEGISEKHVDLYDEMMEAKR